MTFDVRGVRGHEWSGRWLTWFRPFGIQGVRIDMLVGDDTSHSKITVSGSVD